MSLWRTGVPLQQEGLLLKSVHMSFIFATFMFKKGDLHKETNLFTTGSCSESLLLRRDTVTESSMNLMTWRPS